MTGIPTLNPFSPQAAAISHLFVAILLVLAAIFVLVASPISCSSRHIADSIEKSGAEGNGRRISRS